MTYSSRSFGSLPGIMPATLCESIVRILLCSVMAACAPNGTGLNSRLTAAFLRASKSLPAIWNSFFA